MHIVSKYGVSVAAITRINEESNCKYVASEWEIEMRPENESIKKVTAMLREDQQSREKVHTLQ